MPEPTLTPSRAVGETLFYRSVSLLAVFGLLCSAGFAIVLLGGAVVAPAQGTPLLLPRWLLALPATGAVLSLLALRRIRLSEGTMTGDAVAKWALWLSVVGGLGYLAYDFGTGWAVTRQANAFLTVKDENLPNHTGFFDHIQNGNINRAFLLTLQPYLRENVDPENTTQMQFKFDEPLGKNPKGKLTLFHESELIYLLQQAKETKPVALAVKSWKFEKGRYVVERIYKIDTPEMELHFLIRTLSAESKSATAQRKWYVVPYGAQYLVQPLTTHLKRLGQNLKSLREASGKQFNEWCRLLGEGGFEQKVTEKIDYTKVVFPKKPANLEQNVKKEVKDFFAGNRKPWNDLMPHNPDMVPWKNTADGKLQFTYKFLITLLPPMALKGTEFETPGTEIGKQYAIEGEVLVESTEPLDPHTSAGPGEWNIVRFRFVRLRNMPTPLSTSSK